MANPFPQEVQWPPNPTGPFVSLDSGPVQGRVFNQSGHIELAGPDLAGTPHATVIRFSPPAVQTPGGTAFIGAVVSTETLENGLQLKQNFSAGQVTTRSTFPHDGVLRYEVTDWAGSSHTATAIAATSDANEHFYGFGEKFVIFDQAGRTIDTLTFDDPGVKKDHAYKVAPWFISTRGYGLHFNSPAETTFDMRAATHGRYIVANPVPDLAFQLVYGPRLTDVLTRFTGYTGRPPQPPPFTFGPWISSDIWRSGGEVRYAVIQFRQRNIPVSAFVFDSPWEIAYNDFRFNMTQFGADATIDGEHHAGFSSVSDMIQFFQTNGLKVICWMTPFVNTSSFNENVPGQNLGKSANYDEAATKGFFVRASQNGPPLVVPWWKGNGSPIDFTNPDATKWLQDQLQTLLTSARVTTKSGARQSAIAGFKTDDGESGNGPNVYIPNTAHYADGRTGVQMRNGYCVAYQNAVWNVLRANGILFARSGFIGSQAFPGSWAGDNEPNFGDNGLPGVIVAGLSAAMSGYAIWGHDTGGYQDTNFSVSPPNLFMRWAQFGCFSPIMQMHRQVSRELQYPWRYGQQALDNYRFYARMHTQLFPYINTYAQIAANTGLPIIRPLVLQAQQDANTFGLMHVYQFGNELLVAPIVEPNATTRGVYLPAGAWFDFWTHERHTGGQTITWTDTDPMHIPLFVRAGGIVPMLLTQVDTLCDADYVNNPAILSLDSSLLVLIYPEGQSSFTLFDGDAINCAIATAGTTVTVSAQPRTIQLQVHTAAAPQSVRRDNVQLTQATTPAAFDAATNVWRFDPPSQAALVKFNHTGGTTTIQL
jgi:alpha-D-xyloside xylohydrolase